MDSLVLVLEAVVVSKWMKSSISTPEVITPENEIELLVPVLEVMASKKEIEPSVPISDDVASEKEIEPSVLLSDSITAVAKVLAQEDALVPTLESLIPI